MSEKPTFEKAFSRLEEILEKMSAGAVPLEESLALYEEADKLIDVCSLKLTDAEKKIQILVKNSDGSAAVDEDQNPVIDDFKPDNDQILGTHH